MKKIRIGLHTPHKHAIFFSLPPLRDQQPASNQAHVFFHFFRRLYSNPLPSSSSVKMARTKKSAKGSRDTAGDSNGGTASAARETHEIQTHKALYNLYLKESLAQVGLKEQVFRLLRRPWWQHLFFGIREPTYLELT
ncbi:unnamed protein product [Cuscuta europaea]|uniref:Uncharacterized protein n=1 Tax=Cuscuta europaea TaxID=41803 RepID=A0A9P0ZVC8_CUSEU|nr:unnamed protein product [Cuscuta europaea]